ncbi:D-glycero-beta-D-manno-heptose 1-phosphate adenylyltransferase [Thermopolyspora sp. NPDC052614]|uniref:D-glycero-beta-D-manno-heptose 1-phosphate adenylyltransferase n=1 Tax=Thermopolyspora sp. NPDC052614 TaxID=3155682 RepID=UPI00343CCF66
MIERFTKLKVVVVGDVMLDSWLQGPATRMAQEAPVPVVSVERSEDAPGGAANTAVNLAALGANVHMLGVVGDDPPGALLTRVLRRHGVTGLLKGDRRTAVKRRIMAGHQLVARYDEEDRSPIPDDLARRLIDRLRRLAPRADVVVACDYGAGVCTEAVRAALCGLPLLVVDAHDVRPWADCRPTAILPNFAEVSRLLGDGAPAGNGAAGHADRIGFLTRSSQRILDSARADIVVTTLDGEGTLLHRRGRQPYRTYAVPAPDHMSTGAGDTFTAAFALGLAAGGTPEESADLGQAAARVVVRRPGTAACTRHELIQELGSGGLAVPPDILVKKVAEHREQGDRVVFTNGCFDVLHRGHVACLEEARSLGDVLIVAVNADASVARLKGPDRPINACEDRVAVLAALDCVDYVVVFDEDDPGELIRLVRPDVYVKGGDYHPDLLPEAELVRALGGTVRVLEYVPDRSTTAIVNRIRERT